MQFIDQAPAYRHKSISLKKAVEMGRAKVSVAPECQQLGHCLRPELTVATGFDKRIDKKVKFNDLPTPEKLDLMITELLPDFYHADQLPQTGREAWVARFLVDGDVERILQMDATGLHVVDVVEGEPDFELETDIMTLMAILRSVIAEYHHNKNAFLPSDSA